MTLAVLGRRGSGKSSLLNALLDAPRALVGHVTDTTSRDDAYRLPTVPRLLWIDAPGLRGVRDGPTAEDLLERWDPALTLLLVSATEVETSRPEFERAARFVARRPSGCRRCIVAVSKVDELDPVDVSTPPFLHPLKTAHIAEACGRAARMAARVGLAVDALVPLSALVSWRGEAIEHDGRWNLSALVASLRAARASVPEQHAALTLDRALAEVAGHYVAALTGADDPLTQEVLRTFEALLGAALPRPGVLPTRLFGARRATLRALDARARRVRDQRVGS